MGRIGLMAWLLLPALALAQPAPEAATAATAAAVATTPAAHVRSGLEIYNRFRDGLADPDCDGAAFSPRWR